MQREKLYNSQRTIIKRRNKKKTNSHCIEKKVSFLGGRNLIAHNFVQFGKQKVQL